MTYICGKWQKYMGNGFNGLNMLELTQTFWEMAEIFGKWLRCI